MRGIPGSSGKGLKRRLGAAAPQESGDVLLTHLTLCLRPPPTHCFKRPFQVVFYN